MAALAVLATGLTGCASGNGRRSAAGRAPLPEPREYRPLTNRDKGYAVPDRNGALSGAWSGSAIPRSRWTTEPPRAHLANRMRQPDKVTVHHDGMDPFTSTSESAAMQRLELIRRSHTNNGWADIGYHFAIDPGGRVYQCRPLTLQGAHVKDHNDANIGVLVLGNYGRQRPTDAAERSLAGLLTSVMNRYSLSASRVYTHQELRPTQCPGANLQRFMTEVRRDGSLA